jgi:hypothetical protein
MDTWPDRGTLTVEWRIDTVSGSRRLGWTYRSDPDLDRQHAITLLRDVADELEMDLPEP